MANKKYLIYISFLFLISCRQSTSLNPKDYISWVNNNTVLTKEQKIDPFIYSVKYIPYEFNIAEQMEYNSLSEFQIDSIKSTYSQFISFIFKIRCTDNSTTPLKYNIINNEDYNDRLQYSSFNIYEDFFLVIGNDTLKCSDSHFIHEYSLRPYNTIILNFEKEPDMNEINEDITLIYEDYIWGNGILKFKITKSDISKIPILNYTGN